MAKNSIGSVLNIRSAREKRMVFQRCLYKESKILYISWYVLYERCHTCFFNFKQMRMLNQKRLRLINGENIFLRAKIIKVYCVIKVRSMHAGFGIIFGDLRVQKINFIGWISGGVLEMQIKI